MSKHDQPSHEANTQSHKGFPGPTVASIDEAGCQYVLQQTGATTNCNVICPTVSPGTIQAAFVQGNTAPPAGYSPPADLAASVSAWKAWEASKHGGKKH